MLGSLPQALSHLTQIAKSLTDTHYYSEVGQCPGTLIGPQRRDTWTLGRFSGLILPAD
jgi:hypothetical protein